MEGELNSSRYGPADHGGGRGVGSGRYNRHHYTNGRRGRGRGRGRHNRRHHPYNNNNRRNHGPRPGNRFANTTRIVDPEIAMQRQLAAMVSRVGELKGATAGPEKFNNNSSENGKSQELPQRQRQVIKAVSKNIQDLSLVLCSEGNAPLFLKFEKPVSEMPKPSTVLASGPLAALLVNCAAALPLQTPAYVGLTLAVDKLSSVGEYSGFAQRCVNYSIEIISQQIDLILLGDRGVAKPSSAFQVQLLLRYLALLARVNLVLPTNTAIKSDTKKNNSMFGLLMTLTQVAIKTSDRIVSNLFKTWILATLPYLPREMIVTGSIVKDELWTPLADLPYESHFAPGVGCHALLLFTAQHEEGMKDEDDEDAENDEDEDEDDEDQICDTLQDLMKCLKPMVSQQKIFKTRFTLPEDAPWIGIDDSETSMNDLGDYVLLPDLTSKSITAILQGGDFSRGYHHSLESAFLFGRLPIFGSPADVEDDNEDDEMDETNTNLQLQAYENNFNFLDRYLIADAVRACLLNHETIVTDTGVTRGSAKETAQQLWSICHVVKNANINDEKGSQEDDIKNNLNITATSWENNGTPPIGIEYILIETLLSLILQSSSDSYLRPLYLSRVLLELVRVQPAVMPQALAVGVSNLFQFYLPTLVPLARQNFSRWFAFHLINTDYQWPKAYWDHWASYVVENRNSRGDFITYSLEIMRENLSCTEVMVTTCLPPGSVLVHRFRKLSSRSYSTSNDHEFLNGLEKDIKERLWERNEDPELIRDYIIGDEVSEGIAAFPERSLIEWCRTKVVFQSIMHIIEKKMQNEEKQVFDAAEVNDETSNSMREDDDTSARPSTEDVLAVTTDAITRYKFLIEASLEKDMEDTIMEMNDKENDKGRATLLESMAVVIGKSHALLEGCLICLLDNDIVTTRSVLIWLLGKQKGTVSPHWVNYSTLSFRVGLHKLLSKDDSNFLGMVVDKEYSTGEAIDLENITIMKKVTNFVEPLLKLATSKVVTKLFESVKGEHKGLLPVEVDLVEGLKRFIMDVKIMIREVLLTEVSAPLKMDFLHENLAQFSGSALTDICREIGLTSKGIDTLMLMLEKL